MAVDAGGVVYGVHPVWDAVDTELLSHNVVISYDRLGWLVVSRRLTGLAIL